MGTKTGNRACVGVVLALAMACAAEAGDYRLEKRFDLAPGGSLSLSSEVGSVKVLGSSAEAARVVVESEREDFAQLFEVEIDQPSPDRLEVRLKRRGPRRLSWGSTGRARIEVELPRRVSARLHTSGGRVEVRGIDGELSVESSGGRIVAEEIGGDVALSSSGGGVEVAGVRGSANLESSGGAITASDVGGDLEAGSSGGGVRVEAAGGAVVASSSGGPVRVAFAPGNGSGGSLSSSGGGVVAVLDPSVSLDIDAEASGGWIDSELPIAVRGRLSRTSLRGKLNRGGAVLKLRSSGGGIQIRQP